MTRIPVLWILCCAGAALSGAREYPVSDHTLANGMKIIVQENHAIPNVALYLFFRVGSRNEKPGITGISHFLEHMMFNGSKAYGPREFDQVMENNGGSNNAYTTRDVTVYSDWFSRSALDLVLSMEAERLANLKFDPGVTESERNVVLSEWRTSVENDNSGFLEQELHAALYRQHPYRWPVLGWERDIRSWTVADLRAYFERGYAPNNCVMVAVGDVAADHFVRLAEKYFAPLPRRDPLPPVGPAEPAQHEERRVEVDRPAQAPRQVIAYHVPPTADPDYWPMQTVSALLTLGRGSRLYHRLVRHEKLAVSVSSWLHLSLDPGEFVIDLNLKRHADPAGVDRALDDEMERLKTTPVPTRELQAARNKLLTAHARAIHTDSGMAEWLGSYAVFFGDYRKLFSAPQAVERVTAQDVQRVTRKYLVAANRTIATLKPTAGASAREPAK